MHPPFSVVLLCLTCIFSAVLGIVPSGRYQSGCVLLNSKLYCYGGAKATVVNGQTFAFNDHVVLDLLSPAFNASEATWQNVPNPSGFSLEPNYAFAMTAISSSKYLIASGLGPTTPNSQLANYTVVFDTTSNLWDTVQSDGMPQTSGSAAVWNNQNTVWFYGGRLRSNSNLPFVPGFNVLNYFSNRQWGTITGAAVPPLDKLSANHGSAFSTKDNKIYFVGGINTDNTRGNQTAGYFFIFRNPASLVAFDTVQQSWSFVTATGGSDGIPSVRELHTLTYLPNTDQLLMYGGNLNAVNTPNSIKTDFCWIFDIKRSQWTSQCNQSVKNGGAGPRYGHSAALYKNRYLLIAFGVNTDKVEQSDVNILDTSSWNWVDTLPGASNSSDGGNGDGDTTSSYQTGLGGGAIAGIVVGAIAALAFAAFGAFCFIRKRRNNVKGHDDDEGEDHDPMFAEQDPRATMTPPPIYDTTTATNSHLNQTDTISTTSATATQKPDIAPIRLESVKPYSGEP